MRFQVMVIFLIGLLSAGTCNSSEYPLREEFPNVKIIEPETLSKNQDKYIVVDVRSKYEFDIIHMQDARNVPLAKNYFSRAIKLIREQNPVKGIVFYCNGKMCAKSYKASVKVQEAGIGNVLTMDAGILSWVRKYPEKTVLMGESPAPAGGIISAQKFREHILSPSEFVSRIGNDSVVIDVRDEFQRKIRILEKSTQNVPLGKTQHLAREEAAKGKTLLIYDAVGKQVRWLQYYLEKAGIKNYYFMEEGVEGYLKAAPPPTS